MAQYDPLVLKAGIPTVLGSETLRADLSALAGLTTAGLNAGDACRVSGAMTLAQAIDTNASGVVGVYDGVSGSMVREGSVVAGFISGLTVAAGEVAYVSGTAGKLTNVKPSATGRYQTEVGVIFDTTGYVNPDYTCVVMLQPQTPVYLPA